MLDHETDGNLRVALATWVFALYAAGVEVVDPAVRTWCSAVADAADAADGERAGLALIEGIAGRVEQAGSSPEQVTALARSLFGDTVNGDLGAGTREDRLHRIRAYQFRRALPWLARVWERHVDGSVAPSWLLVSEVTDLVRVMDPNPWNEVEEDRALPVADFQVLWELDDCTSLSVG
jgi:hypothetical protein